jgi:hypothetical protein
MDAMVSKPLKAFIYQDQEAHLAVHQAFLQDPQTAAIIGQNPNGQAIVAAMQAHIAEHFGFKYRQQIEQQLGAPIPYLEDDEDEMPEEYEVQVSRMVAQAAQQLLQQNQAQAAQQQAQQQMQDPIIQMQMKELELQEKEIQRKTQKDQADVALRQEQLSIDRQRVEGQLEIDGTRIGAQIEKDKDIADRKSEYDGTKLGIDMMKSKEQNENQRLQTATQLIVASQNKGQSKK